MKLSWEEGECEGVMVCPFVDVINQYAIPDFLIKSINKILF